MASSFEIVQELRARIQTEGRVLRMPGGAAFGLFDPAVALEVNAANFERLQVPPRVVDVLLNRREADPVQWEEVRTALFAQFRRIGGPDGLQALHDRMQALALESVDREVDLTWTVERLISNPLIPVIIDGLSLGDRRAVVRDQDAKLQFVLAPGSARDDPWQVRWGRTWAEIRASRAVARTLKRRLSGKAPPQEDLAQAILPFVARMGLPRVTYTVTTLLTAVAGAPGSVAACLLHELTARPEWADRIAEELSASSLADLIAAPVRRAPVTNRFIKEALRLWSFPVMARRTVHRDVTINQCPVAQGGSYFLSSYITHRDPEFWKEPERFDPNRWLTSEDSPPPGAFVPFGWAPMTCVGAALGLSQLILFCRMATVDFRVEVTERGQMRVGGIATPAGFRGRLIKA